MENNEQLLNLFLNRWPVEEVASMKLTDYVDVKNRDTYCQWIETRTRSLGSNKGSTSIKFGIYKRWDPDKKPEKYINDAEYTWLKRWGDNRTLAFVGVKEEIIKVINYAQRGEFSKIDNLKLSNIFKWKVAFLYSNQRLIPIFDKKVLFWIARNELGMTVTKGPKVSSIQEVLIQKKPARLSVFGFMEELFGKYRAAINTKPSEDILAKGKSGREGTTIRNISSQERNAPSKYIANQTHNKIQQSLYNSLVEKYGKEKVKMEKNYVDIQVEHSDRVDYYEVKSDSYASGCIKQALGQVLSYIHGDMSRHQKESKVIVVGPNEPNADEQKYITFLRNSISQEFEYLKYNIE